MLIRIICTLQVILHSQGTGHTATNGCQTDIEHHLNKWVCYCNIDVAKANAFETKADSALFVLSIFCDIWKKEGILWAISAIGNESYAGKKQSACLRRHSVIARRSDNNYTLYADCRLYFVVIWRTNPFLGYVKFGMVNSPGECS